MRRAPPVLALLMQKLWVCILRLPAAPVVLSWTNTFSTIIFAEPPWVSVVIFWKMSTFSDKTPQSSQEFHYFEVAWVQKMGFWTCLTHFLHPNWGSSFRKTQAFWFFEAIFVCCACRRGILHGLGFFSLQLPLFFCWRNGCCAQGDHPCNKHGVIPAKIFQISRNPHFWRRLHTSMKKFKPISHVVSLVEKEWLLETNPKPWEFHLCADESFFWAGLDKLTPRIDLHQKQDMWLWSDDMWACSWHPLHNSISHSLIWIQAIRN